MLHEPAAQTGKDHAAAYKTRLGLQMFFFYALFYAGFVVLNVVSPVSMEIKVLLGMNLACTYGFGLIIVALIMALIYTQMCSKQEAILNIEESGEGTE